ncbi:DsbA family oxidoreductase [Isachenkonia alkalipeptolytica]|uniref:DsbA family oxidoreductase n=1 Tax=Isachenkonia alkalipeptolytica TaxID=2565777 RepID=A0AA44BDJ9_9CLOT|nr:DsbA family oxidoreductase [Isachenkonia alkalipeptolytica]NBG88394.1 DsbA family oxidoreductase [Isachenkonia alkalipeptolytica]
MKIEMWSDYVCPFCYMGKRHLDIALQELHLTDEVDIEFKSYQLNPEIPAYSGEGMQELLSKKYNLTLEEAENNLREVQERAEKVGLYYDFEDMKPTNTLDAHRLTKYARTLGKDQALAEKIFKSYFEKGGLISDHDELLTLCKDVGIVKSQAYELLSDPNIYQEEVRRDMAQAEELKIQSVPFFRINQDYVIPGSESIETFVLMLQKIIRETS